MDLKTAILCHAERSRSTTKLEQQNTNTDAPSTPLRVTSVSKLLLIMKLTTFLLLSVCLTASASGGAQSITLNEKNASLETVLKQVQRQTGYQFIYTVDVIQKARPVSIAVKNSTLEQVLELCFKNQPLDYSIIDKLVVIKEKAKSPNENVTLSGVEDKAPPIDIKGRILDENGKPVIASVQVKGTNKGTTTNDNGEFELKGVDDNATLIISGVSIESFEVKVNGRTELALSARMKTVQGEEVIINTGYQRLRPNEITGAISQINNQLFNRKVSTDILSRLDGVVPGLIFNRGSFSSNSKTNINIRGVSTIDRRVSSDPLIVVDDFIFEGDINDLNPNDVENVSVLKDAAAASIWGARAGNGVIVITTKKAKNNVPLKLSLNSNLTIISKPDIFDSKNFLHSKDYIEVEKYLFNAGLYNPYFQVAPYYPESPVVDILEKKKNGLISEADANSQISQLASYDVRDDYLKYIYQKGINQQYSLGGAGGTDKYNYNFSIGFDKSLSNLRGDENKRVSLRSFHTYYPIKNLEITGGFNYIFTQVQNNNANTFFGGYSVGGLYGSVFPYTRFVDESGNNLPIVKDYRASFVDSMQKKGLLSWTYNPIDEINSADNVNKGHHLIFNSAIRYRFRNVIVASLLYQNEMQFSDANRLFGTNTYYTRNLINKFAQISNNGSITYPFPFGEILNISHGELKSSNIRGQITFDKQIRGSHQIDIMAGAEIREVKTNGYETTKYGYNSKTGAYSNSVDFITSFPVHPVGSQQLPVSALPLVGTTNRFISYYSIGSYSFKTKYLLTLSARKDGANIFGVRTNDRVVPLWSSGLAWDISKEDFYHLAVLPSLKFRVSFGYNGNLYNGAAYLITRNIGTNPLTNAEVSAITLPPNSTLRWERVKNINAGFDFGFLKNLVTGNLDLYEKRGIDLIEPFPLAPSTGFSSFVNNSAEIRTKGVDFSVKVDAIKGAFSWSPILIFNYTSDKVLKLSQQFATEFAKANYLISNGSNIGAIVPFEGNTLFGIYSYKWNGLDNTNGDPLGSLGGKSTKNYDSILNFSTLKDIVFSGSARPRYFGSFRNEFGYKNLSVSVNLIYKFDYFFRRSSTSLNYTNVLLSPHEDFTKRWQNPGDEKKTDIPSIVYPSNNSRDKFYQNSNALVERADHIRLQDIQLSYSLNGFRIKSNLIRNGTIYSYMNNVGIIWRRNGRGIDPDNATSLFTPPNPFSIAFGFKTSF